MTARDAEYAAAKLAEILASRGAKRAAAVATKGAAQARPVAAAVAAAAPTAAKTLKERPVLPYQGSVNSAGETPAALARLPGELRKNKRFAAPSRRPHRIVPPVPFYRRV